ncbi:hypothetical protein NSU_2698 [Novosphingobium pentaromativorans US6-1]|uniref:Uncharacterized protein n=1 Tax=Novosphingobium pentaromativorans US6-1 TaxID=1088721 RepID=G6EEC7_9SPHN|nr:hypothetical protein NSU_2698 [Novosphingobium pentaromativorans US6-1]
MNRVRRRRLQVLVIRSLQFSSVRIFVRAHKAGLVRHRATLMPAETDAPL